MVPQIKVWTEFIISTLSSKERSGDPFKSTSMLRKFAVFQLSKQHNSLANEKGTDIKVVEVVFNIIPTRTPQTN